MNIRCAFCQTPYTLSRNEILFALQKMDSENLHHYDAHCPRCRRATQLPRQRIEMAFPNWRQAIEEAASTPVTEAPVVEKPVEKTTPTPAVMEKVASASTETKKAAIKSAGKKKAAPAKATASKAKPATAKKTASKPASVKSRTTKKK